VPAEARKRKQCRACLPAGRKRVRISFKEKSFGIFGEKGSNINQKRQL